MLAVSVLVTDRMAGISQYKSHVSGVGGVTFPISQFRQSFNDPISSNFQFSSYDHADSCGKANNQLPILIVYTTLYHPFLLEMGMVYGPFVVGLRFTFGLSAPLQLPDLGCAWGACAVNVEKDMTTVSLNECATTTAYIYISMHTHTIYMNDWLYCICICACGIYVHRHLHITCKSIQPTKIAVR